MSETAAFVTGVSQSFMSRDDLIIFNSLLCLQIICFDDAHTLSLSLSSCTSNKKMEIQGKTRSAHAYPRKCVYFVGETSKNRCLILSLSLSSTLGTPECISEMSTTYSPDRT